MPEGKRVLLTSIGPSMPLVFLFQPSATSHPLAHCTQCVLHTLMQAGKAATSAACIPACHLIVVHAERYTVAVALQDKHAASLIGAEMTGDRVSRQPV